MAPESLIGLPLSAFVTVFADWKAKVDAMSTGSCSPHLMAMHDAAACSRCATPATAAQPTACVPLPPLP
jgi:hypothetical protein